MATDNRPVQVFKEGAVQVSIWMNRSEKTGGQFYRLIVSRSYKDGTTGEWKDSASFGVADLCPLTVLLVHATDWIRRHPLPGAGERQESVPDDEPLQVGLKPLVQT